MSSDTTNQHTGGIGQPVIKPDRNLPIRYGIIGGMVMCLISILSYLFYRQLFGSMMSQAMFGFLFIAIMIFIPVWGTVSYKRAMGGLSFTQALSACMVIIFITLTFSSVISYIIPNFLDTEYPQQLYDLMRTNMENTMEKYNATDEDTQKALERISLEQFTPTITSTIKSMGVNLGLGFILSLIVALFVSRNSKKEPTVNTEP
ncbi:MAG TPA: DUF4199 domain-containing protein [Chitinophagales bacterium]|nr:DUF4199 domain-containing protein [Chitinophagales bacterium]